MMAEYCFQEVLFEYSEKYDKRILPLAQTIKIKLKGGKNFSSVVILKLCSATKLCNSPKASPGVCNILPQPPVTGCFPVMRGRTLRKILYIYMFAFRMLKCWTECREDFDWNKAYNFHDKGLRRGCECIKAIENSFGRSWQITGWHYSYNLSGNLTWPN